MIQVFRVSTPEQYSLALAIRQKVFVQEQGVPVDLEVDEHEKAAVFFIAMEEDRAVATGRYRLKSEGVVKFERVATLAEYRGKNIGTVLMRHMQDAAILQYPNCVLMLHAQKESIRFYERLGWQCEGPIFHEAGIEHRKMVLTR